MLKRLTVVLMFAVVTFPAKSGAQATQPDSAPKVRTYYVAADEVEWDYAPGGVNKMMGMKFEGNSKVFTERGPHRIGTVYRKALYREYTDATFTKLKPRAPEWEHAGILGPILRAEVGDTIRVIFKNNATHPYSMHPHGVFYDKSSEGALYDDAHQARTRLTTQSRPVALTPTPGRFRSEPAQGRTIPAPSYGSTTRIRTKPKTYRAD